MVGSHHTESPARAARKPRIQLWQRDLSAKLPLGDWLEMHLSGWRGGVEAGESLQQVLERLAAVKAARDAGASRFTLTLEQSCGPSPGQPVKEPYLIPVRVGLLGKGGR